jgi:hypothetical protein
LYLAQSFWFSAQRPRAETPEHSPMLSFQDIKIAPLKTNSFTFQVAYSESLCEKSKFFISMGQNCALRAISGENVEMEPKFMAFEALFSRH